MKKNSAFLLCGFALLAACDLQPKIISLPDTVGDFITARYPALLADPTTQPEIYNSAATDYGVYAAPELYGTGTTTDDYVLYASVDDYIVPPDDVGETADTNVVSYMTETKLNDDIHTDVDDTLVVDDRISKEQESVTAESSESEAPWEPVDDTLDIPMYGGHNETEIIVARGDTLYAIGAKYGMSIQDIAKLNNLLEPYRLSVGQKLQVRASTEQVVTNIPKISDIKKSVVEKKSVSVPVSRATTTRVDLTDVTIAPGDTLYSLSRKYSVPVNDLAVMNNLSAPFALYAGQVVKVPNLASAPVRTSSAKLTQKSVIKQKLPETKAVTKNTEATKTKNIAQKPEAKKTETQKPDTKPNSSTVKKLPAITTRSSSLFSWPVRGKILSNYGAKSGGLFNDGINIGASRGTVIGAAENGVVAYAGNEVKGMGNLVIIQHSDGWMTVYAHMDSLAVRRGAKVNVGSKIGTVGQTGKVDKPQLHFEVRKGTKAYNPIQYLKK